MLHLERLSDVRERRTVDRLDGGTDRRVRGEEDDLRLGRGVLDRVKQLKARNVGQLDVDDGHVDGISRQHAESLPSADRGMDGVPSGPQHVTQGLTRPGVVVDDEDAC